MTFFEQELKKIFGKDMGLSDIRIVGNEIGRAHV